MGINGNILNARNRLDAAVNFRWCDDVIPRAIFRSVVRKRGREGVGGWRVGGGLSLSADRRARLGNEYTGQWISGFCLCVVLFVYWGFFCLLLLNFDRNCFRSWNRLNIRFFFDTYTLVWSYWQCNCLQSTWCWTSFVQWRVDKSSFPCLTLFSIWLCLHWLCLQVVVLFRLFFGLCQLLMVVK